jgi:hypothetical protein
MTEFNIEDAFNHHSLLAFSYFLQQKAIPLNQNQEQSALLALDVSLEPKARPALWCVCHAGKVEDELMSSIDSAWMLADLDGNIRNLLDARQKCEDQKTSSLTTQLETVLDQEPAQDLNHHLLICLGANAIQELPPKNHLVQHFASITVVTLAITSGIQVWHKWVIEQGGRLLIKNPLVKTKESFDSILCQRFEKSVFLSQKPRIYLKAQDGISIKAQYCLSPELGSIQWDGDVCVLRADVLSQQGRAVWLIDFQPNASKKGRFQWASCRLNQRDMPLFYEVSDTIPEFQGLHPMIGYAKQIALLSKTFELMLQCYSKQELRKVLQQIDMFLKLSLSFDLEEQAKSIYEIKVKFLTLGKFKDEDYLWILNQSLNNPFIFTHQGKWLL